MTIAESQQLSIGIYVVYWKSGGGSLAAVGQGHDGRMWCTPCNWLGPNNDHKVWRMIRRVEPVRTGLVRE